MDTIEMYSNKTEGILTEIRGKLKKRKYLNYLDANLGVCGVRERVVNRV